jgi:hypothetical protein
MTRPEDSYSPSRNKRVKQIKCLLVGTISTCDTVKLRELLSPHYYDLLEKGGLNQGQ